MMVKRAEPLTSKRIFSGKFLQLFVIPGILHAIWDMPSPVSIGLANLYPVQLVLTIIIWFFMIKIINTELKQIEDLNKQYA